MSIIPGAFTVNVVRYIPIAEVTAVRDTKKPVMIMFPAVMAYILEFHNG